MRCPQCGHENAVEMKFCGECGTHLAVLCRQCRARNAPAQKFCGECGARLAPDASSRQIPSPDAYTPKHLAEKSLTSKTALEGERKHVTVLFADPRARWSYSPTEIPRMPASFSTRLS